MAPGRRHSSRSQRRPTCGGSAASCSSVLAVGIGLAAPLSHRLSRDDRACPGRQATSSCPRPADRHARSTYQQRFARPSARCSAACFIAGILAGRRPHPDGAAANWWAARSTSATASRSTSTATCRTRSTMLIAIPLILSGGTSALRAARQRQPARLQPRLPRPRRRQHGGAHRAREPSTSSPSGRWRSPPSATATSARSRPAAAWAVVLLIWVLGVGGAGGAGGDGLRRRLMSRLKHADRRRGGGGAGGDRRRQRALARRDTGTKVYVETVGRRDMRPPGQGQRRDRSAGEGEHLGPRRRQDRQALRRGGRPRSRPASRSSSWRRPPSSPRATSWRRSSRAAQTAVRRAEADLADARRQLERARAAVKRGDRLRRAARGRAACRRPRPS